MELLLVIGLVVYAIILNGRVGALEKRLDFLVKNSPAQFGLGEKSVAGNNAASPIPPAGSVVSHQPIPAVSSGVPARESAFYAWLKQDTLVKVGALLLILGVAWFVTYAFANNWIGPIGRILLGLMLGLSLLAFGIRRMTSQAAQGSIFTVVGSTVVILTITAAQYVYEMFPSKVALGIIFVMVILVTLASVQYERRELAYASLVSALLAPFLINSNSGEAVLFMLYLLLVVLGTLWVVWRLRAEAITLVALIGVLVYTAVVYDMDTGVALLFSFVFTGIFFITNIVSLIRRYTKWVSPVHVVTAVLTGAYLISSILASAPEEWVSSYLIVWALIFAYGSYQVFMRTLNKVPFYIYAAVSVLLLGTATAVEFEGALLTITLTLEALAGIILFTQVRAGRKMVNIATALLIVPGVLTFDHMDSYGWSQGVINADLFALLVFTAALVIAGMIRYQVREETDQGLLEVGQKILYSVAGLYGAIILWLVFHSLFTDMVGTMLALIVYSLVGLVFYITGRFEGDKSIKNAGVVILSLVVIRLLMVDVWALEMTGRIITFLVIGLLFMSTALLPKRNQPENNN